MAVHGAQDSLRLTPTHSQAFYDTGRASIDVGAACEVELCAPDDDRARSYLLSKTCAAQILQAAQYNERVQRRQVSGRWTIVDGEVTRFTPM